MVDYDDDKTDLPKEPPTDRSVRQRDVHDYEYPDRDELPKECKPYAGMDTNLEFIIPVEHAEAELTINNIHDKKEIYTKVARVDEHTNGGNYLGVHVTNRENEFEIMRDGFSRQKAGSKSVKVKSFRDKSVYTWHNVWDMVRQPQYKDEVGIVVSSPRQVVTVSNMQFVVISPWEEYVEKHTMPYPHYIDCLRRYGGNTTFSTEKDIIQDLSGYSPDV